MAFEQPGPGEVTKLTLHLLWQGDNPLNVSLLSLWPSSTLLIEFWSLQLVNNCAWQNPLRLKSGDYFQVITLIFILGRFTGQISLVTQPNLCKECNENQAHKIQELNSFRPFKEVLTITCNDWFCTPMTEARMFVGCGKGCMHQKTAI